MEANQEHEQSWKKAVQAAKNAGLKESFVVPPVFSWYRSRGISLKPPHYGSFFANLFWFGAPFAIGIYFVVLLKLLFGELSLVVSLLVSVPVAIVAGGLFGFTIACVYLVSRRTHQLPAWNSLEP